jgi:hypothetical protein
LRSRATRMRGQMSALHQRVDRQWTGAQGAKCAGRSRQADPARITHNIPSRMVRWSWLGRPVGGRSGDKSGAIRAHPSSVNSRFPARKVWIGGSVAMGGDWRVRRATWQRLARAWWCRRKRDQPRCASHRSGDSVTARSSRRTSGTVSGSRPDGPLFGARRRWRGDEFLRGRHGRARPR